MSGTRRQRLAALSFGVTLALAVMAVTLWLAGDARASPPAQGPETPLLVNYQGYLTDASGQPISATLNVTFTLWSAASGGANRWQEASKPVTVTNGLFNTVLGDQTALTTGVFANAELWLGAQVGSDAEMEPRQRLVSAPYAIGARDADTVDGLHAGAFGDISGVTASTGLSGGGTTGSVSLSVAGPYRLPQSCSNGQIAEWNGSAWDCGDDDVGGGGGDITAVYAGNGLTGGGASGAVTVTLDTTYTDGRYWSLTGNGGTTPGANFLGTIDNQALELHVNNARALRLEPGASPNVIGGYSGNSVTGGVYGATIGGGGASGNTNRVTANYATVGGGYNNEAGGQYATVGGGRSNEASAGRATVGGGGSNTASASYTTVGGGSYNKAITGTYATVGGGYDNEASANYATVGGGRFNTASGQEATAGGGYNNEASANYATAGGGQSNEASATYATVGGGGSNTASASYTTVGGGSYNKAITGTYATAGGGYDNEASANYATVGGGQSNEASGQRATVGGGGSNTASATYATVPGGHVNKAQGDYSFAAGRRAKANNDGCFVWGDSTNSDVSCNINDAFIVRASGGVGLGTNAPQNQLHVQEAIDTTAQPTNHVAQIENTSTGSGPDVLALKVGYTGDPGGAVNFITFFKGDNTAVGAIEGNGSGGVTYKSGSGDYAEWLPRLNPQETTEPGDVVGVFGGRVSKATQGAAQVMVVSTRPIVLGNDPGEQKRALYEKVAFVGQVEVKVRGPVAEGDFIVPSGLEDGSGVAVAPEAITPGQFAQVIGQAWEASAEPGLKQVRAAVGLIQYDPSVARMSGRIQSLEAENAELEARLAALEALAAGKEGP